MIYCFDIDGTICSFTDGNYESAVPYSNRIRQINNCKTQIQNYVR